MDFIVPQRTTALPIPQHRILMRTPLPLPRSYRFPDDIHWTDYPGDYAWHSWSMAHGRDIEILVTTAPVGASLQLIDSLPNLRFVAIFGVGRENLDESTLSARSIDLFVTHDLLGDTVADHALALLLAARRGITTADKFVRDGRWGAEAPIMTRDVHGSRLGLLGYVDIALRIARRAATFGMQVGYTARHRRDTTDASWFESLIALATWSDILLLICPATPATARIVDAGVLAALGADGLLINMARGSVVDEPALLTALETHQLGAAALDVFDNEPAIDPRFRALENVLLSPHVGSATIETRTAMADQLFDAIRQWCRNHKT